MSSANAPEDSPRLPIPFGTALRVWARIGLVSFGGPAGQIALMHRILVDELRWIGEARFLHALNFCMLLPGPEAQQLAVYIGWLMHGVRGGLAAGILFILPGFAAILALSLVYVAYADLALVEGLFFGLKAAVLAIVLQAAIRIGRRTLRRAGARLIGAGAFLALFVFGAPFPFVIIFAGLLGLGGIAGRPEAPGPMPTDPAPAEQTGHDMTVRRSFAISLVLAVLWLGPVLVLVAVLGPASVFSEIAVFFSKMAVITFGGAYAVLAYVAQEAVGTFGWLTPAEMLDGLAAAETTPGPLILVLEFVGFLAAYREAGGLAPAIAGGLGAILAVWVTFVPCFLWIFLGAPFAEGLRGNRAIAGALSAITAAVVGVILNLALWFMLNTLFAESRPVGPDWLELNLPVLSSIRSAPTILAAACVGAALLLKVPTLRLLAGAAIAGVAWVLLGGST